MFSLTKGLQNIFYPITKIILNRLRSDVGFKRLHLLVFSYFKAFFQKIVFKMGAKKVCKLKTRFSFIANQTPVQRTDRTPRLVFDEMEHDDIFRVVLVEKVRIAIIINRQF